MSTNHKHNVDKFAAALARKPSPTNSAEEESPPPQTSKPKAIYLPPQLCLECPACHSLVHPHIRSTEPHEDYVIVRKNCPACGGVYWIQNRQRERFTAPPGTPPPSRRPVRYVYKP